MFSYQSTKRHRYCSLSMVFVPSSLLFRAPSSNDRMFQFHSLHWTSFNLEPLSDIQFLFCPTVRFLSLNSYYTVLEDAIWGNWGVFLEAIIKIWIFRYTFIKQRTCCINVFRIPLDLFCPRIQIQTHLQTWIDSPIFPHWGHSFRQDFEMNYRQ